MVPALLRPSKARHEQSNAAKTSRNGARTAERRVAAPQVRSFFETASQHPAFLAVKAHREYRRLKSHYGGEHHVQLVARSSLSNEAIGHLSPRGRFSEGYRGDAAAGGWICRGDESRRRRGCRMDIPKRNRGDAAACGWIFLRGIAATPRPRRGSSAEKISRRRVAATPRLPRGSSGEESWRRRGCRVDIPKRDRGDAAAAAWICLR